MPERRNVKYDSAADIIADVERLRASTCDQCGQWSLGQACWHLNMQFTAMSEPGEQTPDKPEQLAARERITGTIKAGSISPGRPSPQRAIPPAEAPADAVDNFIATLKQFDAAKGPFKTHPLFGNVTEDEVKRFSYIHAAHHLSHFVPKDH